MRQRVSLPLVVALALFTAACPGTDELREMDDDPMIEVDPHGDVPEPDDEELDEVDPDTAPATPD